jgi:predicted amidophosphoribosyltransferase
MLLDLLLPRRCAGCGAPGEDVCGGCEAALRRIRPPLCALCGAPAAWPVARCRECAGRRLAFASARAAVEYDPVIVPAWKERGLRGIALLAADLVAEVVPRPEGALVPIPPDPERQLRRGHHPAGALARELAARWQLPVARALSRPRAGQPQRGLSLAARRRNVASAFVASVAPRAAILVDDVYTTGATASAAAAALRRAGARRVEVVTFARAIRLR